MNLFETNILESGKKLTWHHQPRNQIQSNFKYQRKIQQKRATELKPNKIERKKYYKESKRISCCEYCGPWLFRRFIVRQNGRSLYWHFVWTVTELSEQRKQGINFCEIDWFSVSCNRGIPEKSSKYPIIVLTLSHEINRIYEFAQSNRYGYNSIRCIIFAEKCLHSIHFLYVISFPWSSYFKHLTLKLDRLFYTRFCTTLIMLLVDFCIRLTSNCKRG